MIFQLTMMRIMNLMTMIFITVLESNVLEDPTRALGFIILCIYINWGCFVVNEKSRRRSRLAYSRYNKWFNPNGYNNQFLGARFSWTNNNPYLNGVYNNPNWYNYSNSYCPPGYNGGANRVRNTTPVRNVNSSPRVTGSNRLSTTPSAVVVRRSTLKPVSVGGKAVTSRNFSLPKSSVKSLAANKRKAKSSADRKRATQNRLSANTNRASQTRNNNLFSCSQIFFSK